MPTGVYIRTKEHRLALSLAKRGKRNLWYGTTGPMGGKHHTDITKRAISKAMRGKNHPFYGKRLSESHRKHLSENHADVRGENNPRFGKHLSIETKRKLRLSIITRLKEKFGGGVCPMYNPKACGLIDKYGASHGYAFQHALNGGEYLVAGLGYWVDGYDKKRNVVVEVDEPHHRWTTKRDKERERLITAHLGCKFIRLKME